MGTAGPNIITKMGPPKGPACGHPLLSIRTSLDGVGLGYRSVMGRDSRSRGEEEEERKKRRRRSPASDSEDEGKSRSSRTVEDRKTKTSKSEKKEKSKKKSKSHKSSKHHSLEEKKLEGKHKNKRHKREHHSKLEIQELSSDDYFSKNNEFAMWLKEEKNMFFSDLSSESARDLFSVFIKDWNKQKLESRYYEGIVTGPRTAHKWNIKQEKN